MKVKSLSQMMKPGHIGSDGGCETCGDSPNVTVTRVATANLNKLNKLAQKPDVVTVAIEANEEPKKRGGRPKSQPKEVEEPAANETEPIEPESETEA